ncbi:hypothetical protein ACC733_37875, partial [Rhizobium johnstonii]
LYNKHASLSFYITWIASREERILDEHLLSVGRRTALERASYLIAFLFERGRKLNIFNGRKFIPIRRSPSIPRRSEPRSRAPASGSIH